MEKTAYIIREHIENGVFSMAHYSECGAYRYRLSRIWETVGPDSKGLITFIMLNPSTATELANDPTVERCERRARNWGYSGVVVMNLFAIRATDPQDMLSHPEPVGVANDAFIRSAIEWQAMPIVLAWGDHGKHLHRSRDVLELLHGRKETFFLKKNRSGEPSHPLYLSYELGMSRWEWK